MDAAIERLYDLNVGTTPLENGSPPHERPHKPLLLLAALDLIDQGLATPERIPWSRELRDRFSARFLLVRKHNDQNTPENPFFYLQTQGFWNAWIEEGTTRLPLQSTPLVRDMGRVFARFTDGFQHLAALPATRQLLREALLSRYFPNLAKIQNLSRQSAAATDQPSEIDLHQSNLRVAEEPLEYGRSPAFRRLAERPPHQRPRPLQKPPLGHGPRCPRPRPGPPLARLQTHRPPPLQRRKRPRRSSRKVHPPPERSGFPSRPGRAGVEV